MAKPKSRAAKKASERSKKSALPEALAKRVVTEVAAKRARLAGEAKADIALIRRRQAQITESFYDIGEALLRLKRAGVAQAVGRASFAELCEKDLKMSLATAERLVAIVTHVPREDALRMGQQRSAALVDLANATPEADTAAMLDRTKRRMPSGKTLDLSTASAKRILEAAKEERAAKPRTGKPRGRTTTTDERATAAALQTALHAAGLDRARVTAVATKPGQGADIRIERVPLASLPALGRTITKAR